MASFLDGIPGYWDAVARETIGRDAAYLRLPRLIAGVEVRPLTLLDYLRLSAENSPFVAGGQPGRDDCAFLLWHQRRNVSAEETAHEFAARFDALDAGLLATACGQFVTEALADKPGGSVGNQASYYGLGAMLVTAFRKAYPGISKQEVLNTPMDELFQEYRAMHPSAVMFNPSDRLKAVWLAAQKPPPVKLKNKRRRKSESL